MRAPRTSPLHHQDHGIKNIRTRRTDKRQYAGVPRDVSPVIRLSYIAQTCPAICTLYHQTSNDLRWHRIISISTSSHSYSPEKLDQDRLLSTRWQVPAQVIPSVSWCDLPSDHDLKDIMSAVGQPLVGGSAMPFNAMSILLSVGSSQLILMMDNSGPRLR
ncbi:hypothetical protein H103_00698 [Trichophyton rubrum CBS 288.86]|uniref:Uncharacterized protein n=2 Tax=Trichophyton TaxID=5550 RepID=A0A022WFV1_TRIRU|nr:hypothetical protein H100_00699 [Trichophyton rubrum MR850]EZF46339.1 hypothetical protein H102_00690 [Trichophyton rubrum CBS 100081]EZF56963.1 hypothetical protein H103_00698 [Trichophyton rubrum CBS 288.86]EZF67592.1 hypothetical protein H104_00685 [Trichophyton rubrum CBS 289.86]EZF78302.1 hypothetical protein H105_00693 [Trichophyton soudanense CBS 452.61]EZG21280.1 hypothetical protein H107_00748 [Trichophyton rubrum CBS 202.88]